MKWVFVSDIPYNVSGEFSPNVFVDDEGHQWPLEQNFEQIKESGNMTWLKAEHSNGYNYVNINAVYKLNIYETRNEIFRIDLVNGAGFGVHAEAKLRFTFFRRLFVEAAARGTYIKSTKHS